MRPLPSFSAALTACAGSGAFPVIPDIKRRSPQEGDLLGRRDPLALARRYVEAGAPALSVVTETVYFGGSLELLTAIALEVPVPVLRKDFINSDLDIRLSRAAGAAAVLLIAAKLTPAELRRLRDACRREGLEALVEVHSERELEAAMAAEPEMVGINNRDILRLETDAGGVSLTERMAPLVNGKALLISESGLHTPEDVRRAARAGADAALIGTALLQAEAPETLLQEFMRVQEHVGKDLRYAQ